MIKSLFNQAKGKMREAFNYALNQEKYLKVFLTDGDVKTKQHMFESLKNIDKKYLP